jgi:hypothetical protein
MADTYTARPPTSCWSFNIIEDGVDNVGCCMLFAVCFGLEM